MDDLYDTQESMDEFVEWADILDATKTNSTLKELADQLRVLYHMSEEYKNRTVTPTSQLDGILLDG